MLTVEEAVELIKKPVSVKEACSIIELYIFIRKKVKVSIKDPVNAGSKNAYMIECQKIQYAFSIAVDFLVFLHAHPEKHND